MSPSIPWVDEGTNQLYECPMGKATTETWASSHPAETTTRATIAIPSEVGSPNSQLGTHEQESRTSSHRAGSTTEQLRKCPVKEAAAEARDSPHPIETTTRLTAAVLSDVGSPKLQPSTDKQESCTPSHRAGRVVNQPHEYQMEEVAAETLGGSHTATINATVTATIPPNVGFLQSPPSTEEQGSCTPPLRAKSVLDNITTPPQRVTDVLGESIYKIC